MWNEKVGFWKACWERERVEDEVKLIFQVDQTSVEPVHAW